MPLFYWNHMRLQKDIATETGLSEATISLILAAKRGVSWALAGKLVQTYPWTIREQWMDKPQTTMQQILNQ